MSGTHGSLRMREPTLVHLTADYIKCPANADTVLISIVYRKRGQYAIMGSAKFRRVAFTNGHSRWTTSDCSSAWRKCVSLTIVNAPRGKISVRLNGNRFQFLRNDKCGKMPTAFIKRMRPPQMAWKTHLLHLSPLASRTGVVL